MAQAPIARIIYGEIMVPKIYSSVANTFLERAAFVFFFFFERMWDIKGAAKVFYESVCWNWRNVLWLTAYKFYKDNLKLYGLCVMTSRIKAAWWPWDVDIWY